MVLEKSLGSLRAIHLYLFALGMMIPNYSLPYYWAPVTGLNYLFVLQGIRFWRIRDLRCRGCGLFTVFPF